MSQNIEAEDRCMISESDYVRIFNDYKDYSNAKSLVLTNYYFDDDNLSIRNSHKMLRIRSTDNDNFELTLKIKGENGDLEINEPLSKNQVDKVLNTLIFPEGEITSHLREFTNIRFITSLVTERLEIPIEDYLLVIDKNKYGDVIDYNIEIEAKNIKKARELMLAYCNKYNLNYSPNYESKSRRAINKALKD